MFVFITQHKGQNSQKQDMYQVHHMFSTYFETHAIYVLAHYAHQSSLYSAAQMYTVLHPPESPTQAHTMAVDFDFEQSFLKVDSLYTKICGTKELNVLPDDIFPTKIIFPREGRLWNLDGTWKNTQTIPF